MGVAIYPLFVSDFNKRYVVPTIFVLISVLSYFYEISRSDSWTVTSSQTDMGKQENVCKFLVRKRRKSLFIRQTYIYIYIG